MVRTVFRAAVLAAAIAAPAWAGSDSCSSGDPVAPNTSGGLTTRQSFAREARG